MQVSVESTSNLGRKMTVHVPPERIEPEVEKRLESMSQRAKIDGFRPGKVPLKVAKRRFGADVRQEVAGEVLRATFQEALSQEHLHPAGGPHIEPQSFAEGEGLTYTASFEVYPTVELAPLQDVKLERPQAEVSESDVDHMLETLRKQRRSWEPVERPAADGDQVVMDFTGRIDGEPIEGGSGEEVAVELGSGRMVPGFEAQLNGLRGDEDKTFTVDFPEDYPQEQLAGRAVVFDVHVRSVSEGRLPELDEDFARGFGIEEGGVEALRRAARESMERELGQKIQSRFKEQVMDALLARHELELPRVLVSNEIESLRAQTTRNLGRDSSELPDQLFTEEAQRRVKLGLIIGEMASHHGLSADQDKVQQALERLAAAYDDPQQVVEYYRDNREAMTQLESSVIEEQVVERVQSQAEVVDVPMSFDALMNPETTESNA